MSELEVIRLTLQKAQARRRLARALAGMWRGLFWGAILCLALSVAYHLLPMPDWVPWASAALPLLGALAGFIAGAWRKPSLAETARWLDLRQGLKERLSSALEVSAAAPQTQWARLIVADAANHARGLHPRSVLPISLPTLSRWALLVLALVAGLAFIPEYRTEAHRQAQAEREIVREAGRNLAELTRRELQTSPPALETTERALTSVLQTGEKLELKGLARAEALKELASASDKLKQDLESLRRNSDLRRMEQSARANRSEAGSSSEELQQRMEQIQKELGNSKAKPDALKNLQDKLQALQQAAKAMADQTGENSTEDRQRLQNSLAELSQQAAAAGINLPQLEEAMAALLQDKAGLFVQAIDQAMTDLEKLQELAQNLQQLQGELEKLGKDLAEQLERGQPKAASETLAKMQRELGQAGLSREQAERIMREIAKAIAPAGDYGKVAEHLTRARQQMAQGNKAQAQQALAAASKELEDLMQQLADAKDLEEALRNLQTASLCVGSNLGWGQCQRPNSGKGGKPGQGVGTWADEDRWVSEVKDTGLWDNSGIERPDLDPRGLTDRGEGELNDALSPSKVRGQFSPGGQMPSITLKGVSIKGQSRVAFEEAAAAAQSDAQSALNQDKVPRTYQGPVRDYFDDLKQ